MLFAESFEKMSVCIVCLISRVIHIHVKILSEYDQEIPLSQIADKPMAPRGSATQQSRDTRKTN